MHLLCACSHNPASPSVLAQDFPPRPKVLGWAPLLPWLSLLSDKPLPEDQNLVRETPAAAGDPAAVDRASAPRGTRMRAPGGRAPLGPPYCSTRPFRSWGATGGHMERGLDFCHWYRCTHPSRNCHCSPINLNRSKGKGRTLPPSLRDRALLSSASTRKQPSFVLDLHLIRTEQV